jgi:hypothetical protein
MVCRFPTEKWNDEKNKHMNNKTNEYLLI